MGSGFPQFGQLYAGDLIIHSGCLDHKSPHAKPNQRDHSLVLFPTYASGSSTFDPGRNMNFGRATDCGLNITEWNSPSASDYLSCIPQAYPVAARPKRGAARRVRRFGDVLKWTIDSLKSGPEFSIPPNMRNDPPWIRKLMLAQ